MALKEMLTIPEHEEHAAQFVKEAEKIIAKFEREHQDADFSVRMSNSTDDFVEQMNIEIDEMDPNDPERPLFMSEITLADESTTLETGVSLDISSLSSILIDLFTTQIDHLATRFSGTTDHLPLEESNDEIPRFAKQLFYTFAG